jgi:hypothetical protein
LLGARHATCIIEFATNMETAVQTRKTIRRQTLTAISTTSEFALATLSAPYTHINSGNRTLLSSCN